MNPFRLRLFRMRPLEKDRSKVKGCTKNFVPFLMWHIWRRQRRFFSFLYIVLLPEFRILAWTNNIISHLHYCEICQWETRLLFPDTLDSQINELSPLAESNFWCINFNFSSPLHLYFQIGNTLKRLFFPCSHLYKRSILGLEKLNVSDR